MNKLEKRFLSDATTSKKLIAVVGPTAVGKTDLAIEIARHYDTEVVSADSRQFYKEMAIGTAKPSLEEQGGITHHFIDFLSVDQEYSVGDYEKEAIQTIEKLFLKHDVVVLVGGSGLFVKAVCEGLDVFPEIKSGVREEWKRKLEEKGLSYLQDYLRQIDPVFYRSGEIENPQRVVRAIEVHASSGIPFSQFHKAQKKERAFDVIPVGLNMERDILYARINKRVDLMVESGLVEEVKSLIAKKDLPALKTVGYAELFAYFEGQLTLSEALDRIKQNTRRYAKRQITWFKKMPDIQWFSPKDWERVLSYIETP